MTSKMFQQRDDKAVADEEKRRQLAESGATPHLDGRFLKRALSRPKQVGLRISDEKKMQFDRLRMRTGWTYTEIFEAALDDFEAACNAGRHK